MTWEPAPATSAPVTPASPAPPAKRSSRLLDLTLAVAAVLAIAGVAFAVGRTTAPAAAAPAFQRGGLVPDGALGGPNGSFDPGAAPRGRLFAGGLSTSGTVAAIDADSITLTLEDGREMTFELDASTTYHQAADASASDVAVGDDVAVRVEPGQGPVGADASDAPRLSASDVTVTR